MASAAGASGGSGSSAAALQQYQACLGIMVRLRVEDLNDIKQDFDAAIASNASSVHARAKATATNSDVIPIKKTQMSTVALQQQQKLQQEQQSGLSLEQFVSVMLDRVVWTPENVQAFIEDLIELFLQVDVNGDGTMTWEEFTSAIIEGGMGSISEETDWRDMKYEENQQFQDHFRTAPPKKIQYLPEFRKVLVYESHRPVIDVLDPSALFPLEMRDSSSIASFAGDDDDDNGGRKNGSSGNSIFAPRLPQTNSFHPLCYVAGYRKDQDEIRSERSPVQAVKYLSKVDLIVVSSGDLRLTFWSSVMLISSESLSPLAMVHTPRPQRVLEWNPATNHLYTISADLIISVFQVSREYSDSTLPAPATPQTPGTTTTLLPTSNGKRVEVYFLTSLKKHTDLLQDLLLINPDTLLSCGMDSIIYLWDTHTLTVKGARHGHKRGVRLLSKLSPHMFLSAGFEAEILGWDVSGLSTTPIFRLFGHNAPVCCIHVIPAGPGGSSTGGRRSRGGLASTDQAITVDDDGWFKWWNLGNILSMESEENRCIQTFRLGKEHYPWKCHSLISVQHGNAIVAAGYKLKFIQRVRLKPKALTSCCVIYNDVSFTLLTTTDKEFRIWDACTGRLLRTFRNTTKSDICCVELDARQRKIVFGNANGELFVLNYLNGVLLKTFAPHRTNVSSLVYCKEDKCVLTASWDKSIRLYDDDATNPLLRCITDAHESDIKCLAYSYSMALFASGGADGTIKLWDYVYFLLEDECLPIESAGDVSALSFLEPFPLLVSGHETGWLCLWGIYPSMPLLHLVRVHIGAEDLQVPKPTAPRSPVVKKDDLASPPSPVHHHNRQQPDQDDEIAQEIDEATLNAAIEIPKTPSPQEDETNDNRQKEDNASEEQEQEQEEPSFPSPRDEDNVKSAQETPGSKEVGISALQVFYDETGGETMTHEITRGRHMIICGATNGEICIFDISSALQAARMRAIREESLPCNNGAYNPRRRFLRQGKNAKRVQNQKKKQMYSANGSQGTSLYQQEHAVRQKDIVLIAKWKAHHGSIKSIRIVEEPQSIWTCSHDKSIKVWDFEGNCLGHLVGPQEEVDPSSAEYIKWQWKVDADSAALLKKQHAEELWDTMKDEKLAKYAASKKNYLHQVELTSAIADTQLLQAEVTESKETPHGGSDEAKPEEVLEPVEPLGLEKTRIFGQIKGEVTWNKSDLQIAREIAWAHETKKFDERMKTSIKSSKKDQHQHQQHLVKAQQQRDEEENQEAANLREVMEGMAVLSSASTLVGNNSMVQLPSLDNAQLQELPFDDKDNWAVGSLNRQKLMYTNFHQENVRRNQVASRRRGSGGITQLQKIDLGPSSFLLQKLGVDSIIDENTSVILENEAKRKRQINRMQRASSTVMLRSSKTSNSSTRQKQAGLLHQSKSSRHVQSMPELPTAGSIGTSGQHESPAVGRPILSRSGTRRSTADLMQAYNEVADSTLEELKVPPPGSPPHAPTSLDEKPLEIKVPTPTSPSKSKDEEDSPPVPSRADIKENSTLGRLKKAQEASKAAAKSKASSSKRGAASKLFPVKETENVPNIVTSGASSSKASINEKKSRIKSDASLLHQARFGPYNREDVYNIYKTFTTLDKDGSGSITMKELLNEANFFGSTHLKENIVSIFSSIDKDQSGQIDLPELCNAIFSEATPNTLQEIVRFCSLFKQAEKVQEEKKKKELKPEELEELKALFRLYDVDRSGGIDVDELLEALRFNDQFYDDTRRYSMPSNSNNIISKEEMLRIMEKYHSNENKVLNVEEFIELFREVF